VEEIINHEHTCGLEGYCQSSEAGNGEALPSFQT